MTPKHATLHLFLTHVPLLHCTKIKFSVKDFLRECGQIRSLLRIYSHLLKKSLMKNFWKTLFFLKCYPFQTREKIKGFQIFSRKIEREHLSEIGSPYLWQSVQQTSSNTANVYIIERYICAINHVRLSPGRYKYMINETKTIK